MSKLCTVHFVSNCPLCGPTSPAPAPDAGPEDLYSTSTVSTVAQAVAVAVSRPEPEPTAPTITDPHANTILTVTEQYAQACENYSVTLSKVKELEEGLLSAKELLKKLQDSKSKLKLKLMEELEK